MMAFPMVSDLWGTKYIFTVLDGRVDNRIVDEKGTVQQWKIDVSKQYNS
jgi:hypothetical protein